MTATIIRKRLFDYLKKVDEKKIKAIYTIFQDEIESESFEYDARFKKELDRRIEYYQSGGKTIGPAEMKKRLKAIPREAKK